jgi:hypothetical protein
MLGLLEKKAVTTGKSTKLKGKMFQENVSDTKRILGFGEPLQTGDYFQQGDCLLVQLGDSNFENAPTEIKGEKVKHNVVLKGNTNSHALYEGDFEIFDDNGQLYVNVKSFAVLDHVKDTVNHEHAEHHAQYIPKGQYFVKGIMEFDHLEKMARQVID